MNDNEIKDLKLKINQFLWENADNKMTLDDAENIACKILSMLRPDDNSLDSTDDELIGKYGPCCSKCGLPPNSSGMRFCGCSPESNALKVNL